MLNHLQFPPDPCTLNSDINLNYPMSRLRKIDRAILSESTNDPIDSDDQELIITQLSQQNSASLRLLLKIMVICILVELPIMTFLHRKVTTDPVSMALLTADQLLSLVNCLYDIPTGALSQIVTLPAAFDQVLSSWGIFALNALVHAQVMYVVLSKNGWSIQTMYLLFPVVNIVMVVLSRKWSRDVSEEIDHLHNLKYKFKTA